MYYKKHFSKRNGNSSRSWTRTNFRGRYPIRTFDPSRLISSTSDDIEEVYEIKNDFADFGISKEIKKNIADCGFSTPTPIQDQVIPEILSGKDVVGIAHTGTGKTAAFLIPLVQKLINKRHEKVLVISPTRELAVQIAAELAKLSKGLGIASTVCIGGVSIYAQINKLQENPSFVIGTPGRLLDLENRRAVRLSEYSSIVLDEVDRMLDMGFVHDVQKIISKLPKLRQSMFFSATMSGKVLDIMKEFTQNPVMISAKSKDVKVDVEQIIVKLKGRHKFDVLQELLDQEGSKKVLVFGRTKRGVEKLTRELLKMNFLVSTIHGNKSQNQRQRALDLFRQDKINVLVATDVVARGIDVDNISHVINYELPETHEDYLHRIGRTGRAGKKGVAITLID